MATAIISSITTHTSPITAKIAATRETTTISAHKNDHRISRKTISPSLLLRWIIKMKLANRTTIAEICGEYIRTALNTSRMLNAASLSGTCHSSNSGTINEERRDAIEMPVILDMLVAKRVQTPLPKSTLAMMEIVDITTTKPTAIQYIQPKSQNSALGY